MTFSCGKEFTHEEILVDVMTSHHIIIHTVALR